MRCTDRSQTQTTSNQTRSIQLAAHENQSLRGIPIIIHQPSTNHQPIINPLKQYYQNSRNNNQSSNKSSSTSNKPSLIGDHRVPKTTWNHPHVAQSATAPLAKARWSPECPSALHLISQLSPPFTLRPQAVLRVAVTSVTGWSRWVSALLTRQQHETTSIGDVEPTALTIAVDDVSRWKLLLLIPHLRPLLLSTRNHCQCRSTISGHFLCQ